MDFVALLLCLVVWNHCVYFETFKYYYHWILGLFYYALSSENLVSTLKLLNISIIGFWWLFYYALSSEIIVSTLKLLNSTIIGFWWLFYYALSSEITHYYYCVYYALSFETHYYLNTYYYWILVALLLCLVIWNHRVYFETFKHYYYWILVALLLRLVIWNHRVYFETFKQYYCWILVALLLRLVIWKPLVYFETFKQYYYWILWLFYYALSSEIIVSTLKLLNTTIIGFWGSFTTPCHLKTSCLLWNF